MGAGASSHAAGPHDIPRTHAGWTQLLRFAFEGLGEDDLLTIAQVIARALHSQQSFEAYSFDFEPLSERPTHESPAPAVFDPSLSTGPADGEVPAPAAPVRNEAGFTRT